MYNIETSTDDYVDTRTLDSLLEDEVLEAVSSSIRKTMG